MLLASGKAVPISSLKSGEKVLATNTRTGRTTAEAISVVMVHHDTNLYDLTIRANGRTAVIDTTSNHPFWDATTRRWVKAAALPGSSLRPDAYSLSQRIVRELKPDNPDAIASGWRQVNGYKEYMEELTGEPWTAIVDVYKR